MITRSEHTQISILQAKLLSISKNIENKEMREMFLFAPTLLGFQVRNVSDNGKIKEDEEKDRWWVKGLNEKLEELWQEVNNLHGYKLFKHEKEDLIKYLEQIKREIAEIEEDEGCLDDAPF